MTAQKVKESAKKVIMLICVTSSNNNKYYNLYDQGDDTFMVIRGRVDHTEIIEGPYPMSKWNSIYRNKTKETKKPKPYTDVTHLVAEQKTTKNGKPTSMFHSERADEVCRFVEKLLNLAKESVERNYVISSNSVTKAQVDEAQDVLNKISKLLKMGGNVQDINDQLLELYKVIPRKMKKVQHHLIYGKLDESDKRDTIDTKNALKEAKELFSTEQDALDVMSGQVVMNTSSDSDGSDAEDVEHDILHVAGLEGYNCSPAEIKMIKKKMGSNQNQFVRAIRVKNDRTEKKFNRFIKNAKNQKTDLLWHGSRNENWWSIFQQGLMIRPSNAVITGSMFGHGVYFADKAQKSIGYTSLRGSYWASGGNDSAMLALYEIHQGRQKSITNWRSDHGSLNESRMLRDGYDSVFAKGGADLRNNEFITYNTDQSTIKYLVEIK